MASTPPADAEESDARTALLDATERLMLNEGYAAVTSRRLAAEAGVNPGLVYYYFGPMDNLFVEVFRRSAARMLGRQAEALSSAQPLRALWDLIHDQTNSSLNLEFLALGKHRKVLMDEMKAFSLRFREIQFDGVSKALSKYNVDTTLWPPQAVMIFMDGAARFMGEEHSYGLTLGHQQAVDVVERLLSDIEGKRRPVRRKTSR